MVFSPVRFYTFPYSHNIYKATCLFSNKSSGTYFKANWVAIFMIILWFLVAEAKEAIAVADETIVSGLMESRIVLMVLLTSIILC